MGSYESKLLCEIAPGVLGERSLCFFECMDFPRPNLASIEEFGAIALMAEHSPRGDVPGGGYRYGTWDVQFMYRGYRFLVESNSHAGLGYFWVNDPSCPQAVLIEVLEHLLGPPQEQPAAPPTIRGWRGELKDIGCAMILLGVVVALCLLLNSVVH